MSLPKKLPFVKMQGAGNDFVMLDGRYGLPAEFHSRIPALCDRRYGIGADGVIVLEASRSAEYKMVYYNADGSETICGNGMRCTAKFIHDLGLLPPETREFELETLKGAVQVRLFGRGEKVAVSMGIPIFEGDRIPTAKSGHFVNQPLEVGNQQITLTAVGMGNPHCVIFVDDLFKVDVEGLGRSLEYHPFFPERTNVEFVKVLNRGRIQMRVWERGVGETLACGTGICAAVAASATIGKTERHVVVDARGGELEAIWDSKSDIIKLAGPAESVFSGEIDLSTAGIQKQLF